MGDQIVIQSIFLFLKLAYLVQVNFQLTAKLIPSSNSNWAKMAIFPINPATHPPDKYQTKSTKVSSNCRQVGRQVGRLIGRLIGWQVGSLVGRLAGKWESRQAGS